MGSAGVASPAETSSARTRECARSGSTSTRCDAAAVHTSRCYERARRSATSLRPSCTAFRCVASTLDRNDLVACGDAIVSSVRQWTGRRPAFASIDELRAAVLAWGTRRGASALRWAIERVRTGVDSRPETLTRLLLVAAGLPEPEIAPPVSLLDGRIVHPDLAYPALRIAFEYEGDEHRADVRRWRSDIRRREDLEDCGWRVVRITWDDLTFERDAFIARVRRLVASRVRTAD